MPNDDLGSDLIRAKIKNFVYQIKMHFILNLWAKILLFFN